MNRLLIKAIAGSSCAMAMAASPAMAGGFTRGVADTDILYEPGNFAMRSSVTVVSPDRTIISGPNNVGVDLADTYAVPSSAVKFKLTDNLSCAGTIIQAYGGASTYATGKGIGGSLDEDFTIMEFGATCGANAALGDGRLWVLGGVFTEKLDYRQIAQFGAVDVHLESQQNGWRAGLAYEIPEVALRAQLMYRSGTGIRSKGTFNNLPIASSSSELPQSVELKLQSGVAPGWLVYGGVKWVDWSVNTTLPLALNGVVQPGPAQYFWKDGWTVTAGVGHAFTENLSGTAFVTWDRGVSSGYDLYADTYTFGIGTSLKDKLGGELRLGAAAISLGSVSGTSYGYTYALGNDWAFAGTAGYSIRW